MVSLIQHVICFLQELYRKFERIINNSLWLFAEKITNVAVVTVVGIFVARYLGPEKFGVLNLCISIVAIFSVFSTLGLDRVVIREFSQEKVDDAGLFGSVLQFKFVGSIFAALCALCVSLFFSEQDESVIWIVLLMSVANLFRAFSVIGVWFQSKLKSKYAVKANIVAMLVGSSIKVLLIFFEAPLVAFAVSAAVEALIFASLLIYFYVQVRREIKWKLGSTNWKLLIDGAPLALSTLSGVIYVQFDKLMLGGIAGVASVGIYVVYTQVIRIPQMLLASINASTTPSIMKTFSEDRERALKKMAKVLEFNAWIGLWAMIGVALFGDFFIATVFGEDYRASALLIVMLSVVLFLQAPSGLRAEFLLLINQTKQILVLRVISVFINIGLNLVLIPRYGLEGAAAATLGTIIFYDCISLLIFRSSRPYARLYFNALVGATLNRPLFSFIAGVNMRK